MATNLVVSLEDDVPESALKAIRAAIAGTLDMSQVDIKVARMTDEIPTVVLTVEGGSAEIRAVSGTVNVIHADMDREGEFLAPDEIESILDPSVYTGTQADVDKAIGEAREGLSRYLDKEDAPGV